MPRVDSEKFYLAAIKKHGISSQGLHWISDETQELRFDTILDMLPKKITSIVDAGCGFGDFYHYMLLKNRYFTKYIGIDSLEIMQNITHENTKQQTLHANILYDSLPQSDYYICSGAMNLLNSFETYLFISNCFKSSQKAFIFNILHGEKKSDTYNYISTNKIKKIAKTLHVQKIEIRDDYLENDITVGFYK